MIVLSPAIANLVFQFGVVYPSEEVKVVMVDEKYIKARPNDNEQIYMVIDSEGNVYKDEDDWWYLKFDSSDIYAKLKPNHRYNITTVGWRTPWMSQYPNIIAVDEVKTK